MRNPKKSKSSALKAKVKTKKEPEVMETEDVASSAVTTVWRPGIDPIGEDEELEYDPTAYDCFHKFQVDWPCLSFDFIKDGLGGPRSTFPHTTYLVAGTQAATARQNYVAFLKLDQLGQGRHGKKAAGKENADSESEGSDDEDEDMNSEEEESNNGEPPAKFHCRLVNHQGGINRIRSMPQRPGVVAIWGDTSRVTVIDGSKFVEELAGEAEPTAKSRNKQDVRPLHYHGHSSEGFALDWSLAQEGRLVSGDCRGKIHVWEPAEGGVRGWQVGGAMQGGHEGSVEDLAWSPCEATVFCSCGVDGTLRVWDIRERGKPMISVKGHGIDVNVISWNVTVPYMLASGDDKGFLKIWDLRSFAPAAEADGVASCHVAEFTYHKAPVTSVEWSPYEGSMLASCADDNQLVVWDLGLERDPEEEEALAPAGNAVASTELPAQLLFLHAGMQSPKELHWHAQIPGMLGVTALDGFNLFKPSNL
mmetsp:Transcript_16703/g.30245  ORF Transcript_16703/g.30245 Transcript_16703/m.30245 type:complete len:476 (-) Transcript_16703:307-1734(-)